MTSRRPAASGAAIVPTLRTERRLLRESGGTLLAAVDEVGRGALAGPVTVGVVLVDLEVTTAPRGLRDSKLLTAAAREALVPRLRRWGRARAVAHASAAEIDAIGILRALRLAGERALAQLPARPDLVLLDGNYDWLTRPAEPPTLFDLAPLELPAPRGAPAAAPRDAAPRPLGRAPEASAPVPLEVRTLIKADLRCAAVAAASVLAKTTRDALMVELAARHPGYGWEENKGYASPSHQEGLQALGPCAEHRRSWNLRTLAGEGHWQGRRGHVAAAGRAGLEEVLAADGGPPDLLDPDGPDLDTPDLDTPNLDVLDELERA
ncbi:MAG: ribonuclease HII [Motilibacteraceae bacterium]